MKVKKQFAMHEYIEEENYLKKMAAEGKCLKRILADGFEFEDCEPAEKDFKIFYSLSDFDPEEFKGFKLLTSYTSSKGGHYYYLEQEDPKAQLPDTKERDFMLEKNLKRIERFNGLVTASLLILFVYLYINYKNPLYFIIIAAAIGLGSYIYHLSNKIKKRISK